MNKPSYWKNWLSNLPAANVLTGDFWGGFAAMLVAVPSAIAFGVTIYSPIGGTYAAYGAVAGILGTIALGLVSPAMGGTNRLITAPCAPAAAVMSAFSIQLVQQGTSPQGVLLMLMLTALIAALLQLSFGLLRLGQLIKFMPYPVVSGYLSGVGLVIIISQVPLWLGAPKGAAILDVIAQPESWDWKSILIGAVTMLVTLFASRVTKVVPAVILGLAFGALTYFILSLSDAALLEIEGNPPIVGPIGGEGEDFWGTFLSRWTGFGAIGVADLVKVLMPAATLAVLLSIDTLKTCVVLDALTHSHHKSDRELIGQGLGNLASMGVGGMPGAGQMGATLVNMSSGGKTRLSGSIEGMLALLTFLLLGNLVAWVPIPSLAGILIVIGFRMIDWKSLYFLKSRSTILDFAVIIVVILTAKIVSLIAASGVGIALAAVLFIREQIKGTAIHSRFLGNQLFSKHVRLPDEMDILRREGEQTAIFELQGSLFFGTAHQLSATIEPELKRRRFIVLDMRRVQSVDLTAVHIIEQIEETLKEQGGTLLFSHLPQMPSGMDMENYFEEVGLVKPGHQRRVFGELLNALEWAENEILKDHGEAGPEPLPLELSDIDVFKNRRDETLADLQACMITVFIKANDRLFQYGDRGDELYLIRRGAIRIVQPLTRGQGHHLATFGRGDFFGEMAFLDGEPRSADAYAERDTELFILSREAFENFATAHKKVAVGLMEGLARTLSLRLRHTNAELRYLEDE